MLHSARGRHRPHRGIQRGATSFQLIKSLFLIWFNMGLYTIPYDVKGRGFKAPHMTWRDKAPKGKLYQFTPVSRNREAALAEAHESRLHENNSGSNKNIAKRIKTSNHTIYNASVAYLLLYVL
ncbi:hypothetical protein HanRHA438_Chr10g0479471 [Helianthus annuus]|nr:hypothetical protein HanRHA438_Chr10g0479471 [Helianthus annuus]